MSYKEIEDGVKDMVVLIGIENKKTWNTQHEERVRKPINSERLEAVEKRLLACTTIELLNFVKKAAAAGVTFQ